MTGVHRSKNAVTVLTAEHGPSGLVVRALAHRSVAAVNGGNGDGVVTALRAALGDARRTAGSLGMVVSSMSGRTAVIREATVAAPARENLVAAIQNEARRQIPFDLRESNFDFQVLSDNNHGENVRVLLVAVPRASVTGVVDPLTRAGAEPWVVDVEQLAAVNALLSLEPLGESEALGVLEIDPTISTLTLVSKNGHILTRNVGSPFEAADLRAAATAGEPAEREALDPHTPGVVVPQEPEADRRHSEQLLLDLRRTLTFFFQTVGGRPVLRLYVVGDPSIRDAVAARLRERLGLETIVPRPFDRVPLAKNVKLPPALQDGATMEVLVALGLALRAPQAPAGTTFRVNVYPDRTRRRREMGRRLLDALVATFALGVNLVALAFLLLSAYNLSQYNQQNRQAIERVKAQTMATRRAGHEETARDALEQARIERRVWSPPLAALAHAMPPSLMLTSIHLAGATAQDSLASTLAITGMVIRGSDFVGPVETYVQNLRQSQALSSSFPYVKLSSTWEARPVERGVLHYFQIQCTTRDPKR